MAKATSVDGAAWRGDVLLYDPSIPADERAGLVFSLLNKRNAFGPLHDPKKKSDT